MKFTTQKEDLFNSLQKTHAIVASKSTLSILANVLIEAVEDKIVLTTTNLQVGIRCETPATVSEPGASTVPARVLFAIARELPSAEVSVEIDQENVATISCGDSLFKVLGISREEFPHVAEFDGEPLFTLPQADLKGMLRKTSFAVSREDPRHFLTGMFFSVKERCLTFVATDGRRLSRISHDVDVPEDYTGEMIVPIRAIEELEKMLGEEGEAFVFLSGNQIGFRVGTDLLVSLLIDAKFPDYGSVIPKTLPCTAVLDREEFAAMVRQAALLTSEQSSSVRLAFRAHDLVITASTPELGEARVVMPVKYEGEPMSIGFNPICLKEALACLDEEEVTLRMTDPVGPGIFTGESDFLHLIMPMRLPPVESMGPEDQV
jgi:DNA polymerase-3 subunit beta